jgi:hypothetical protein
MRMKGISLAATCVTAALLFGGCAKKPPPTAVEQQREANLARLENAPPEVQRSFMRTFPDAAITDLQLQPTGTGLTLYKIVYINHGQPGNVVYHFDGTMLRSPTAGRAPATP